MQFNSAGFESAEVASSRLAIVIRHKRRVLRRDSTKRGLRGEGAFGGAESIADSARGRLGPHRRVDSEEPEKNIVADSKHARVECGRLKV